MNFLIAGGSGFIGTALIKSLSVEHQITVVGRDKAHIHQRFKQPVHACTWEELPTLDASTFDIIINLSGYNIAASRWTDAVKKQIIDSRVHTNAALIDWIITQNCKPHFYSANAIGIYGVQSNGDPSVFDESSPVDFANPRDYLSEVGIRWQQSLQPAIDYGMPVTIARFGVVLQRGEGMLKKLTPSFKFGLGSVIGDGTQIMSWVAIDDAVRALKFLFERPELTGAFNITSPYPISQAEFAATFAKVLHRPLFLKTPAFVMRTLFGEMGEYLINRGQRVIPKRLSEEGFQFTYPHIAGALAKEFASRKLFHT